jgi:hypothetical protein
VVCQVGLLYFYEHSNEAVEHGVFKGSVLHSFWNRVGSTAVVPASSGPLLVFMHVPRTGGDAMRTHLFHDCDLELSRVWIRQSYERYPTDSTSTPNDVYYS